MPLLRVWRVRGWQDCKDKHIISGQLFPVKMSLEAKVFQRVAEWLILLAEECGHWDHEHAFLDLLILLAKERGEVSCS